MRNQGRLQAMANKICAEVVITITVAAVTTSAMIAVITDAMTGARTCVVQALITTGKKAIACRSNIVRITMW